jgi:C1A family cysteine protease
MQMLPLMSFMPQAYTDAVQKAKFATYCAEHNKMYMTIAEFEQRAELFNETLTKVAQLNSGNGSYRAGLNHMSDWTTEEYEVMLGLKNMDVTPEEPIHAWTGAPNSAGKDWREVKDVVSAVKDQGACGSCWAFSATEAVESAYVIAGNDPVVMSPQELVDCTKSALKNHGCSGGWYYYAYQWLSKNKTMAESDYPYTSGTTGKETTCAYDAAKGVTNVSSYKQVKKETASIKAAIELGPVNVAVSAGNDVFRNYSSGIVTEADGCPTRVDHAIVAVGWGVEDDVEYYIVRNSWNTTWGDKGYIKIATADGKTGVCGINGYVYYPII